MSPRSAAATRRSFQICTRAVYQLISRQAVLLGRRLDLLLQTASGATCIIELKVGAPPMPAVRDQILDYRECWMASFPDCSSLRLMVLSDTIPEHTSAELANFGIDARTITVTQAAAALEAESIPEPVAKSLKVIPDDTARVRHLLSDFAAVAIRPGFDLDPPWSHEKVFLALVKRGEHHKDLWKKNIYVELYPQRLNCALLYGPRVQATQRGPLGSPTRRGGRVPHPRRVADPPVGAQSQDHGARAERNAGRGARFPLVRLASGRGIS